MFRLPRVYPIVDGPLLARRGLPLRDAAAALLDAGASLLQIRWKEHYTRELFAEVESIAQACRDAGAGIVINDRVDVAMLLGGGVHVGQEDLPAADARRLIGSMAAVGLSTHNEGQLRAAVAEPVDYIAVGPIFATTAKPDPDPVVGVAELSRLRTCTAKPLAAIGGITRATALEVWRAGADSVAVISDLYPEPTTCASIRSRFEEWLKVAAYE